jgi:hypothetical protein
MTVCIGSLTFTVYPKKHKHPYRTRVVEPVEVVNVAPDGSAYHYCDGTVKRYKIPLFFTEANRITLESYRSTAATLQIDSESPINVKLIGNYEYKEKWIKGVAMYEETLEFLEVTT